MAWARQLISLLLIVSVALGFAAACREPLTVAPSTFSTWGLPEDLPDRLARVEVLELPPSVTRVEWLPGSLVELEAPAARIARIGGLPSRLERLDLRYAEVGRFDDIPADIEALDLRWATSRDPADLTTSNRAALRLLFVGGDSVGPLDLPEGLYSYGRFGGSFEEGRSLPRSLRELYLQGPEVTVLRDLPANLTTLYLEATQVRDLDDLPDAVTTLFVYETALAIDRWPAFLSALSVTVPEARWTVERLPPSLRELTVFGTTSAVRADQIPRFNEGLLAVTIQPADRGFLEAVDLPSSLERLDLTAFEGETLTALPAALTDLGLAYSRVTSLASLPPGLERLDLSGLDPEALETLPPPGWPLQHLRTLVFRGFSGARFVALPEQLRDLDVSGSHHLSDLGPLPASLERLDVSFTGLTALPANLPDSLRYLSIAGAPIDSIDGRRLEGLEELVVAAGQIRRLGPLPDSLRILRFTGGRIGIDAQRDPAAGSAN
jgi:Leucine-rich repeat (LRR) protein